MVERRIGWVEHYYPKAHAAVVQLEAPLAVGDHIHIVGQHTDFEEDVPRIELDHRPLREAVEGQEIGVEVHDRVREHDVVFLSE